DGVADAEAHAVMFSEADLHGRTLSAFPNRHPNEDITGGESGAGPRPALRDNRFQMVEVLGKGVAAGGGQPAGRLRPPADELLVDDHEAGLLELLQVDAEVAVG